MCLAIPTQVIELIGNERAIVNLGGVTKEISLVLLENIAIGDYVIIHTGYALARIDETEAQKTLELFARMLKDSEQ